MKEQFCTYRISKILKELGFDEPCLKLFRAGELCDSFYNRVINQFDSDIIAAPLWQQAIDWFRKEFGINVIIDYLPLSEGWFAEIYYINDEISGESTKKFKSYEECREKAVLQTIELIKNNK